MVWDTNRLLILIKKRERSNSTVYSLLNLCFPPYYVDMESLRSPVRAGQCALPQHKSRKLLYSAYHNANQKGEFTKPSEITDSLEPH